MMPGLPTPQGVAVRALAALAVAAVGFLAGWAVNGWRMAGEVEGVKAATAQAYAKALETANTERDTLARKLATVDTDHSATLRRLTDENDRLRAGVAAGSVRVRVPGASCPSLPQAPAGSSVDSGTGALLTAEAGQDFLNLRAAAIRTGEKLAACQDAVRTITGQ